MSLALQDLLKEGFKHFSGHLDVTFQCIDAVKKLAEVTRTSMGPNGMNKMVINHLDKLYVTSDAATILKELDIIHPAANVIVMASQQQEKEVGDGTNFVLTFSGELLQNAEALLRKGVHINDIITGYSKALDRALVILEELVCFKLEDMTEEVVTKSIKSAIASKQFGYENMLAPLVARACLQVLPKNPKNFNVDNVRVCKILGGGVLDTAVIKGHVLARDAEGTIRHVTNAKVVVYTTGIDQVKPETKDTVLMQTAEDLLNYSKSEEAAIGKVIQEIAEAGVTVIVSGSAIGEMAMHFIERYKMMAVKVMSKFDLRRVAKAVGATPLVKLAAPTPEDLGYADIVTVEEIGSTKVTIFRQDKESSGISTLIIRASTNNMLDDMERAVDDGVNVFKGITKDNRFLAGAGASDIELAKRLQAYGDSTPGLIQYAIRKFGEAFEVVPRSLAENSGLKTTEVLSNLYAAHASGKTNSGIDVETGEIIDAPQAGVLDLYLTKYSALKLATEAVLTVLRVDQIIMAKRAGGPKPPQQGPIDADD